MASDRQRARQRRRRSGSPAPGSRAAREDARAAREREEGPLADGTPTPDPLDHASAEVDQARLAEAGALPPGAEEETFLEEEEEDVDDLERAPDELERELAPARRRRRAAGTVAAPEDEAAVRREPRSRGRVLTFLRHSYEELRRVQWPDRRHVGQATAVVLGFVVLAGGFLGLMDAIWRPVVDAIL